jgi:formiminotetrahydrofolate cyclodeaminase
MITESPVNIFLDELASSKPAPGGGSAAGLMGANGAALVSMVCNLTIGKKKFAAVEPQVKEINEKAVALRLRCLELIEKDIDAYTGVSNVYKMPKETEADQAARHDAMQKALKVATMPPMHIVEACVEILKLCMPIAEIGNPAAVSDAGVGALAAEAAMRSGALNVLINLGLIEDKEFVARERAHLEALTAGMSELKEKIVAFVISKL